MRTGKIKGALLAFVLALVAACGVACGGTTSDAKIVITGTPENGVVTLTDSVNTLQLGYELSEGKGDVVWRSGDEEIATVDDSGKVTLIDSGAVVITATLDKTDVKADALLTVKDERAVTDTITLSGMPETNTVQYEEGSLQLSAVCSNASATLVWTSSDETVATVNDSGLISFVGGGTTDITVYKKGQRAVRATASLTVIRKVEAVTIGDVNSGKVIAGYDYRLKQPYEYALQTEYSPWNASAFELEWSVDDAAIAEIDQNGVLTGKESGNVTVTAQVKGSEIKATKEFEVVKLDDTVEDFSLAVANRFIIGEICVDGWTDYTGAKVTSHNAGIFIDEYDSDKHMLTVEKNTNFMHWSHVCFGCWELAAGKYQFTIELEVTRGEFAGVICGAVYGDSKAEYEGGIRAVSVRVPILRVKMKFDVADDAFAADAEFRAEKIRPVEAVPFAAGNDFERFSRERAQVFRAEVPAAPKLLERALGEGNGTEKSLDFGDAVGGRRERSGGHGRQSKGFRRERRADFSVRGRGKNSVSFSRYEFENAFPQSQPVFFVAQLRPALRQHGFSDFAAVLFGLFRRRLRRDRPDDARFRARAV